jgi:hypothetical protein
MEQKEVMHGSDDVFFDDCPTLGEKEANETISPGAFLWVQRRSLILPLA